MKVANSNVNDIGGMTMTVFSRRADGTFNGGKLRQHEIGNPFCWVDSVEEVLVRIEPTRPQLNSIVEALDAGTISFKSLKTIGGEHGGFSEIAC